MVWGERIHMIKPEAQLLMLQNWFSASFPIGGFSYSHGLESAVQEGLVTNEEELEEWIKGLIEFGSLRNDLIFLKMAYEGAHEANDLALSLCASRERYVETTELGKHFRQIISQSHYIRLAEGLTYPVAIGKIAKQFEIDLKWLALFYLQGFVGNLVSIGIRIIPIGQLAGQRIILHLQDVLVQFTSRLDGLDADALGGFASMADMMAMKHETSQPRLFRT